MHSHHQTIYLKIRHYILYILSLSLLFLCVAFPVHAQEVIFKRSTVWRALTPNDKLSVQAIADPIIDGIVCYYTIPERGGISGSLGVAEEVSDISISCQQIGPVLFKEKAKQGDEVIREKRSIFFKKMRIVRGCDTKRNVLVYMVYSDKLIEGSPKNSTSAVVLHPWGTEPPPRCSDWISN